MARALLGRIFRRRAAQPDSADDDAAVEALTSDLSLRLSDRARAELQADFEALRKLRPRDRPTVLAKLFCRVEDHLAMASAQPRAFRAQFREATRRHWPELIRHDAMALVLMSPDGQEASLCRFFLRMAMQRARDLLGAAAGDRLGKLARWLDGGLDRGEPPPFATGTPADNGAAEPIALLHDCSRGFYAWLHETLGERAGSIYEGAYRKTVEDAGAADGFPAVLGMVPEHLLTADKLGLLRRSQIEDVLKEKIAQLEHANLAIQHARDTLEERVRARTEDLENANHELAESMEALAAAKQQAENANRAKSEFLANMSHELRTPLNAILGFSQMMTDPNTRPALDERYSDYAQNIYDSGAHLLGIIDEILDTAKLEAGRYELREEPVPIPEIVGMCLTTTSASAAGAGLKLERTIAPGLPAVMADRGVLIQMLLNLLGNAIKFTEPGGTIRVEAKINDARGLDLAVHDDGIGIAQDDIPLVLQPFVQVRDAYLREKGGTGLGLPLVVGMARLHGGEFTLHSTLGAGTSAIISLPEKRFCRTKLQVVSG